MSKELNCKWYFGPEPRGNEHGPNNPTALTFKGTKYHSLIRESIQNSLDAVDDPSKPVEVSFDHREFSGMDFPEFFQLKEHIKGCLDKYPNDENAVKLFEPMLKYFQEFRLDQNIGYLRIVDTNTTGMHYDPADSGSAFNALFQRELLQNLMGQAVHSVLEKQFFGCFLLSAPYLSLQRPKMRLILKVNQNYARTI